MNRLSFYSFPAAFAVFLLLNLTACSFNRVSRTKNITYAEARPADSIAQQQLDIYAPRKVTEPAEVLVFIHGGNWNSGKRSLYSFLGNRMARKGIVTVVIEYPLSPQATYNDMATTAAQSVKWVQENIREYGGDPDKIFVSGHSAGGHLAALIAIRNEYFDSLGIANPIQGAILIDAAGLDMYGYLKEQQREEGHTHLNTFTTNQENWKAASPLYHLHSDMPPLLIYRGGETYPSIIKSNEKFVKALKVYVPEPHYHIQEDKKHIPMITQFFWTWNPRYDGIIHFMETAAQQQAQQEAQQQ